MTGYLRPTAPIAAEALLPGDPGRALGLAQALLERPRMANHNRGLWGYSGRTSAGRELTIQATGIGGPSVAVVLAELAELGVRRAIRLGTCRALDRSLAGGELLSVGEAIAAEGASVALGAETTTLPDPALAEALGRLVGSPTIVASADLLYDPEADARRSDWAAHGARAVEMGSATLFELGRRLGVAVASGLVVTRTAAGTAESLGDAEAERASLRLGALAVEVLESVETHSVAASEAATPRLP